MFVGVCRLTFQLFDVHSLKAKRSLVHRLVERTRAKFNISVAEVADNDVHQRAVIAFSVVGNNASHIDGMMNTVSQFMENMGVAPLLRRQTEVISVGDDLMSDETHNDRREPDMTEKDFL